VAARQLEARGDGEPAPMALPFQVMPSASQEQAAKETPAAVIRSTLGGADLVVPLDASDFTQPEDLKPGPDISPAGSPCPKCDGAPVYVSRPRTAFERLFMKWRIPIVRCHRCYHRYVVVWSMPIRKNMPKHLERRLG
jgi:hypothetical protein